MSQKVLAVLEVAIEFRTFLSVDEESLKKRIANDLRAEGYTVNDIGVLRYLVESPSTPTPKET